MKKKRVKGILQETGEDLVLCLLIVLICFAIREGRKTGAGTCAESHNQKIHRCRGTYRCQRRNYKIPSHNNRIYQVIKLLENISQKQWYAKS